MDLKVTQENLSKALNHVARVASNRSTLPILSNVLLQTEDNRLKVSATNLDIAISQHIGTKITTNGSITVPARLFQDFVSNLPKTTIQLVQDEHRMIVIADKYKSTINGISVDEYPVMPQVENGESITIPTDTLKSALQQVVFAASSDEARPVLTGTYLNSINGHLYIAATDSYRLSEKKVIKTEKKVSLLVPSTALLELLRILADETTEVIVTYNEQLVSFVVGGVELIARLIEGQYPDYKKLIPAKFENTATVKRSELVAITKISGLFSRENAGSITISVNEESGQLSVMSAASQVGENQAATEGVIKGTAEVTLNSRYLLDGLQAIKGDSVELCFNGKLDPVILKSPDDLSFIHIIMPLKS